MPDLPRIPVRRAVDERGAGGTGRGVRFVMPDLFRHPTGHNHAGAIVARWTPEPVRGDELISCLEPSPCRWRSEEHTSELQSLMRISYAVFCLKKKRHQIRQKNTV